MVLLKLLLQEEKYLYISLEGYTPKTSTVVIWAVDCGWLIFFTCTYISSSSTIARIISVIF